VVTKTLVLVYVFALGIEAVNTCSFSSSPSDELPALNAVLHEAMISYVFTVQHIPRSVHPLLSQVLTCEFQAACSPTWGLVRLLLFAKVVLRLPSKGKQNHRSALYTILSGRLRAWQEPDGFVNLWRDWQQDASTRCTSSRPGCEDLIVLWSLHWAREGRYGNVWFRREWLTILTRGLFKNCFLLIPFTLHLLLLGAPSLP